MIGTRFKALSVLAVVFHVVQSSTMLVLTVQAFKERSVEVYITHKTSIGICYGFGVAADASITSALLAIMYQGRNSRTRNETQSVIDKCITYLINTGFLVLVCNTATLSLAMATTGNMYWAAVSTITSRICGNTFFSVLNSRNLQEEYSIELFGNEPLRAISRVNRIAALNRWNVPQGPDPGPTSIAIRVSTQNEDDIMPRVGSQRCDSKENQA
ncbi:hypothetical protein C8Q76DRAFT_708805 [Earliella scabrosa]|nr:hypothetical protein C8Q76DRAFT_708805 [Earliella scabrosa]